MPLSPGPWAANINGVEASINFVVAPDGMTSGAITFQTAFANLMGIWDETSQKLVFISEEPGVNGRPDAREYYEACLITTPRNPPPGQDIEWTLAGTVQSLGPTGLQRHGSNARRSRFGWYAKTKQVA
jgi:hypothetical protein